MTSVQTAEKTSAGANARAHWPAELQQELEDNRFNPIVGSTLVSETDKLSICDAGQAGFGCHRRSSRTRVLASTTSFRMTATRATMGFLPAATSRR